MDKATLVSSITEQFKDISKEEWSDKIKEKMMDTKTDEELEELKLMYERKLEQIQDQLDHPMIEGERQQLSDKLERLKLKYATLIKENDSRKVDII